MNVAALDLVEVQMQHLRHGRTGHVRALLRQTAVRQIPPRMLGIGEIHVGDNVDDPAVRFLRQTFILAAVAGFHVKDRDMQTLRADHRKTRIRVAQHQHGIGTQTLHELIGTGDDIAHRFAEVCADGVEIDIRIVQFQIAEENTVERIIVICPVCARILSKYRRHLRMTAARRMISGRVPTMMRSFSFPLF